MKQTKAWLDYNQLVETKQNLIDLKFDASKFSNGMCNDTNFITSTFMHFRCR